MSLLASLAAFVVMISLRLVLLYGWRSRRVRPKWTGSARWFHVLGFQALGLPLVTAAIRSSAFDAAALAGRLVLDCRLLLCRGRNPRGRRCPRPADDRVFRSGASARVAA